MPASAASPWAGKLDVDKGLTPDRKDELFADLDSMGRGVLAHTTVNSTPENPRLRILPVFSRGVTPEEFELIAPLIGSDLGPDVTFDSNASFSRAAVSYAPAVIEGRGTEFEYLDRLDEDPWDVDAYLARAQQAATEPATESAARDFQPSVGRGASDEAKSAAEEYLVERVLQFSGLKGEDGQESRDLWLTRELFILFGFVKTGCLPSREEVVRRLGEVNEYPGTDRANWDHVIDQQWKDSVPQIPNAVDDRIRQHDVALGVYREDVKAAVRQAIASRDADLTPFDIAPLSDVLGRPPEPTDRIAGLTPWNGSTLIVAQRKTGKTTAILNLARCLISGDPFLDLFDIVPIKDGHRVAIMNFEVSGAQLARWADDAGVDHERLILVNLRGHRNPFKHPEDMEELAGLLRAQGVESLIVDPFGRAFPGASQNDAGEVQSFLVQLDEFARGQAGALDLFLTAHAGWNGERTRGSSALEDWADAIWTMTQDTESDSEERYFRATGRDVDLAESKLIFDPVTRRLSLGEGSRKKNRNERKLTGLVDELVAWVADNPGQNISAVEEGLRKDGVAFQRGDIQKALRLTDQILIKPGKGPAKLLYPAETP